MNRGIQIAVFFDELPFLGNPSGGIARSTVGLAEALGRLSLAVMAVGVRKSHFLDPLTPSVSACNWRYLPWISRKSAWIRNLARRGLFLLFSRIRRRGLKIVYHSNGIGSDPWIASRADLHVVTIHDLIPERLDRPDSLPKTSAVLQRKQSLKTSHGLIWVSLKTIS